MKKWHISVILIFISILLVSVIFLVSLNNAPPATTPMRYTYAIVNKYPHKTDAFTEGLVFENGVLYESTGLYGASTLRRTDLETGNILQVYTLSDQFFGEGITIFDDKIVQLTWQSKIGFVYDKNSFEVLRQFNYQGEGWGITYDGTRLIMSNGTAMLNFLDTETFHKVGEVEVHYNNGTRVSELNELEYIQGKVYANLWTQNRIAIIDPQNGLVTGVIDLSGIPGSDSPDPENVLNGIAYDSTGSRLFVTGKRWPQLFEIKLILQNG